MVLLASVPIVARAEVNLVSKVTARAEGPKTVITVHGSATPSFTAYRLERPARVVVDLADGRLQNSDGPIDVDTWAVGQIGMAQYADEAARTARVMIGFKRPASYDVRAQGHDVIITITPDEMPPADQLAGAEQARARAEAAAKDAERARAEAEKARREAEAAQKQAERARVEEQTRLEALKKARAEEERRAEKQLDARKAEDEARARAESAKRDAAAARASAQAAQAELERVSAARKAEQAKSSTELAQATAEMSKLKEAREREQSRLEALKAEADKLAQARADEARKLGETQAQARRIADAHAAKLEEARIAVEKKAQAIEAARAAEERRMRAQAEEAERLAAAAEAAKKAQRAQASESASQESERKSSQAAEAAQRRAHEAANAAAQELQRVEAVRAEARKLQAEAQAARAEVERARGEARRLDQVQADERARVEAARAEAKQLAAQRAQEAERAAHAVALASQERSKIDAAEREARRIADDRARESTRLEQIQKEAQALAEKRALETRKLDEARAEAKRVAAQREAELEALKVERGREEARLEIARHETERLASELDRLARERQAAREGAQKMTAELQQLEHEKSAAQATRSAVAQEVERLEAEKRAAQAAVEKKQAARTQAERAAERAAEELQRLEGEKRAAQDAVEKKLAARGAAEQEAARLKAELERLENERRAAQAAAERERRAAQAAGAEDAERAAEAQAERARLDEQRRAAQAAVEKARAAQALAARDAARLAGELKKLEQERRAAQAALDAEKKQAQLALDAEKRAAQAALDEQKHAAQAALDAEKRQAQLALDAEKKQAQLALDAEKKHAQAALDADKRAALERKQAVEADTQRLAGELKKLEHDRAEASEQGARDRSRLQTERAALERKLEEARVELQRLEQEAKSRAAQARLDAQPSAKVASGSATINVRANVTAPAPASANVSAKPTAPASAKPIVKLTRVRDVRFSDEGDVERITVELQGDAEYTVLRSDPRHAILRIASAELPRNLERTLDASAFQGPVKSVSTYRDPDDAGAVRVVVAIADGEAPEPTLTRDGTQLAWQFPRAQAASRSYPPQKVGAFGASIPLQVAASPSLPSAGGRRKHVYTGRRIEMDFKDADIHNILRLLADVGQVNIVTTDDVKGTVTIRMRDVPWDQALDVILKSKGLGMQREGNLIRVAPAAVLEKELEQEVARAKAAVELKPIDTRLIPLSYADAAQIMPRVGEVMSPRGKVSIDARTNMLIVSDVASNIALAEDLVRNLDTQTPQVLIEARVVEARSTFLRDIGIQWGGNSINSTATGNPTGIAFPSTVGVAGGATDNLASVAGLQQGGAVSPNYAVNLPAAVGTGSGGALGLTLGSVNGTVNINLRLSALENTGNVRIVSAPKITTLDNIEATIEQGVAIPISVVSAAGTNTVFVDAKLNLTVKPHVTNEGSVIMNVAITRNEPDFVNTGARGDPTILKKQARTEMLVRDGDTAVIGGIYTRNTGLSYAKVPWFADIPIFGWLFKNRRENDDRTELLIFITPRIVNRAQVTRR
ncbi:MAG TPA: type IV pilus secretin PilQ [Polyangia bacterium]|nr:type IV pilus secretin PilQ [Polyangia bacterium]